MQDHTDVLYLVAALALTAGVPVSLFAIYFGGIPTTSRYPANYPVWAAWHKVLGEFSGPLNSTHQLCRGSQLFHQGQAQPLIPSQLFSYPSKLI